MDVRDDDTHGAGRRPDGGSEPSRTGNGATYAAAVRARWPDAGIWDLVHYDTAGDLWLDGLRLLEVVRAYGTPVEVVDTRIVERRCRDWMALAREVADETGYPGRLGFLYAAKANMAAEVAHAAYRAGWHAETSSAQDLSHLRWMRARGLLPDDLRVVCNGFKLPPARHGARPAEGAARSAVDLPPSPRTARDVRNAPYASQIVEMARDGWSILPILDAGELPTFLGRSVPALEVGLRAKFGPVHDGDALARHVSRFGMTAPELASAAERIADADHLTLTTLHAMVGAAQTVPVPVMVDAYGFAARMYARLRRDHPTLREFNMGGGVPPLGEPYDHRGLLRGLFGAMLAEARAAGVPPPDFTFEFGSLVAAECGLHVFHVLQEKVNDAGGMPWAIVDGGLMAAIPDMLLIDKPFRILALSGADRPARGVILGDLTCDSDGRYPPESFGADATVLLPEPARDDSGNARETWIAVLGVGAYQEILAGVRGAHHCGLLEAVEVIIEEGADGAARARVMPRQTQAQAAELLGYTEGAADALAATMVDGANRR